jgi:hypothetical protein
MNMATALSTDFWEADHETLSIAFAAMDSTSQIEIPTGLPAQPPERIIVRELDFMAGASGPLGFRQPDRPHACGSFADVQDLVARIVDPNRGYDPNRPSIPYKRPLDVSLRAPTCFIFRLSDNWNWRFSRSTKAATLGPNVGVNILNYGGLRHVLPNLPHQEGPFTRHDQFCKLIYFFARPVAGNPTPGFNHAYNLNIELVFPDDDQGNPNVIPIVIDPDVRHPGGSGDEPIP